MKKNRIALVGASGRMGKEILAVSDSIVIGVSRSMIEGLANRSSSPEQIKKSEVDVIIDFSTPEICMQSLKVALKEKIPFVSGTTGLSADQEKQIVAAAKEIPVLWESNMSLGVTILREALQVLAKLKGASFQIEEIHHKDKKDTPSGTAKTLQQDLEKATGKSWPTPLSVRGGGVFGEHRVRALCDEETLCFEHVALNRSVFAKGAVKAADWIAGREPGFYKMKNVLGL